MKITVTDKGEGWVQAKLEAESATEAMILATVGMTFVEEVSLELKSGTEGYGSSKKRTSKVTVSGFSLDTHDIVK
jgi:hypothetical protein